MYNGTTMKKPAQSYRFSIILLVSLFIGSLLGVILKEKAAFFKPFGDIFLNLLFTIVVPLVFFSISSAVASMASGSRLGKILGWMMVIFVTTGAISSVLMIMAVKIYPPAQGMHIALDTSSPPAPIKLADQLVKAFTVSDFGDLLSKKNMLALIVFSLLVGLAASRIGEKGRAFTQFLMSANDVMAKVIDYIMLYAPFGLGAYFAYLVGVFGPELFGSYFRAMKIYYPLALAYFFGAFTFYAYLAGGGEGVRRFWKYIIPASLTALATGSSIATIPTNMEAAKKIGIPEDKGSGDPDRRDHSHGRFVSFGGPQDRPVIRTIQHGFCRTRHNADRDRHCHPERHRDERHSLGRISG